MNNTVAELHVLSLAITDAGSRSFVVRRILQRLEAGEITIDQAILALRERPYMDSSSFASQLMLTIKVRLLTYIRPHEWASEDAGP